MLLAEFYSYNLERVVLAPIYQEPIQEPAQLMQQELSGYCIWRCVHILIVFMVHLGYKNTIFL